MKQQLSEGVAIPAPTNRLARQASPPKRDCRVEAGRQSDRAFPASMLDAGVPQLRQRVERRIVATACLGLICV